MSHERTPCRFARQREASATSRHGPHVADVAHKEPSPRTQVRDSRFSFALALQLPSLQTWATQVRVWVPEPEHESSDEPKHGLHSPHASPHETPSVLGSVHPSDSVHVSTLQLPDRQIGPVTERICVPAVSQIALDIHSPQDPNSAAPHESPFVGRSQELGSLSKLSTGSQIPLMHVGVVVLRMRVPVSLQ
jgi:hypothetical protein